jgi:hypothetical protein
MCAIKSDMLANLDGGGGVIYADNIKLHKGACINTISVIILRCLQKIIPKRLVMTYLK